jgi:hypothetical protein
MKSGRPKGAGSITRLRVVGNEQNIVVKNLKGLNQNGNVGENGKTILRWTL